MDGEPDQNQGRMRYRQGKSTRLTELWWVRRDWIYRRSTEEQQWGEEVVCRTKTKSDGSPKWGQPLRSTRDLEAPPTDRQLQPHAL